MPTMIAVPDVASGKWTTSVHGTCRRPSIASDWQLTGHFRVGGPVGENNLKFFIQFNGYTALYCFHLLVVMAYYIHMQVITEV